MADISSPPVPTDREGLFGLASQQRGYFTSEQAARFGYSRALLAHHARVGTFRRIRPGLYRFRDYPSSPREEVVAAWLALGKDTAVVSHESALDLWELSDVIPEATHLTVPRTRRYRPPPLSGVVVHTTTRPLASEDVVRHEGVRITAPARTLLDAAEMGTAPEQIEAAVRQALARGWVEPDELRRRARERGGRVARLIERGLAPAGRGEP